MPFNQNASLSNAQRDALRRAINAHHGWPEYSRTTGMTLLKSSSATCIAICNKLGIDCAESMAAAGYPYRAITGKAAWGGRLAELTAPEPVAPAVATGAPDPKLAGRVTDLERQAVALNTALQAASARINELEVAQPPRGVAVTVNGVPTVTIAGHVHPLFDELLELAAMRDVSGNRLNIWVAGPTGSGKTHAAKQVALALGYEFDFHGAMLSDYQLTGYVSQATGEYVETPFVRRFLQGGVILLDELDAGSNEALLALNAALANGIMSLPDGRLVERHPDCVVIGCANTWGEGPTATFVGRNKLDAAFLSRFAVSLNWGYDLKFEEAICGNVVWARVVQHARRVAADNGMKVVIDPRQSIAGAALIASGWSISRAADRTFLARLTDDQRLLMTANIMELN